MEGKSFSSEKQVRGVKSFL